MSGILPWMPFSLATISRYFSRVLLRRYFVREGHSGRSSGKGLLVRSAFLEEADRGLGEAEDPLGVIGGNGGAFGRFPPVSVGIAVGVLVDEIGLVVAMILKPVHGRASFAEEGGHIVLPGLLQHLGDGEVLGHVDLPFVHHDIVYGNATDPGGGLTKLDAGAGGRADRRRTIGIGKTHPTSRKFFQVRGPVEVVGEFRPTFHHGHAGLGVAQVIGVDDKEIGRLLGPEEEVNRLSVSRAMVFMV